MAVQYSSDNGWTTWIDAFKKKIPEASKEASDFFKKISDLKAILTSENIGKMSESAFNDYIKNNNLADESLIKFLKDSKQGTKDLASYQEYLKTTGKQTSKFADFTQKAGNVVKGFGAALGSMAVMWAIGEVVSLAAKGFDELKNKVENTKNSANDLISTFSSAITTANNNADTIEALSSKYETLSKGVNNLGENVSLTTDEYTEYNNIVNQIADMFPNLISGYTNEGNAILSLKGNVEQLRDAYKDAQKEAYNMLVASGENSDGNDIIKDYQNVVSGFKGAFAQDEMGAKQIVDMLTELNSSFGDVDKFKSVLNEFQKLANENNEAYHSKEFQGILDDIGINDLFGSITSISSLDDEDLNKASDKIAEHFSKIKATIQTYQAEIDSVLNNTRTLANAYLMTNDDYNKLDEQSKNAASVIVNSLNENIASGFESKEDVGAYVQDILDTINSNPEVKNAMIGLFTSDFSDMPVEKSVEIINQYINSIAEKLGENPLDLKIRLGFDDFDNLETQYKNAISSAQEKFGKDETGFFETNSINTKEEIDAWLGIAQAAGSAEEAERKYIEQGKTLSAPSFIPEFENLPTDKIEEYISLVKSGNIDEGTISSYSELNDLMQETGMSAEDAAKALKDYADGYKLSTDLTASIQDAYDLLKDVEEQYKKTGLIGLSSLESIANTYPQLRSAVNEYTQGLISADDMIAQLSVAYENDADAYKTAMAYKLSGNEEFFSSIYNNNKALFDDLANAYGLDVENWKTMAQAKAEIDQKLIQSLSAAWSKYYSIVFDSASGMASVEGVAGSAPEGSHGEMSKAQRNALDSAFAATDKYNDIVNRLNEAANITVNVPDFGGIGSAGNKSGGGSSKKEKEEKDTTIDWAKRYLDMLNEKRQELVDRASKYSSEYVQQIIALDKQILPETQKTVDAYKKVWEDAAGKISKQDQAKIELGSFDISTYSGDYGEDVQAAIDAYDKYKDMQKQYAEAEKASNETLLSQYDASIARLENENEALESQNSLIESQIDYYKEIGSIVSASDYEAMLDNVGDEIDNVNGKISDLKLKLNLARELYGSNSEEYDDVKDAISDAEVELYSLQKTQAEYNKTLAEMPITNLSTIISMYEDIGSKIEIYGKMATATGQKLNADYYQKLISNQSTVLDQYKKQIKEIKSLMSEYEKGSDNWQELYDQLQSIDSSMASIVENMAKLNEELLQMPLDNMEKFSNSLQKVINGLTTVQSEYDTVLSAVANGISDYISQLEDEQDAETEIREAEINLLQDKLDLLKDQNEALSLQTDLEQALFDLEEATNNKTTAVNLIAA